MTLNEIENLGLRQCEQLPRTVVIASCAPTEAYRYQYEYRRIPEMDPSVMLGKVKLGEHLLTKVKVAVKIVRSALFRGLNRLPLCRTGQVGPKDFGQGGSFLHSSLYWESSLLLPI